MKFLRLLNSFPNLLLVLLFVAIAIKPEAIQAQTKIKEISPTQANIEVNEAASKFGFSQAFLSNSQIDAFRAVEGSAGIRLYTALDTVSQNPTIIAVAVTADGTELGEYAKLKGVNSIRTTKDDAAEDVNRSVNSSFTSMNARVKTSDLINQIMKDGANGIHIKPGNDGFILVAATGDGNGSVDFGVAYNKLEEPCPPLCEDNTLIRMD